MSSAPGVVLLQDILTPEEQLHIIKQVTEAGGLRDEDGTWNFFGYRGRRFCALHRYDDKTRACLETAVGKCRLAAEASDTCLAYPPSTHLLTWLYPDENGIGWHRDDNDQLKGGNNGDDGAPVYSLTLGNACIFEYQLERDKTKQIHEVRLESGTMLVFGGPQRLMRHRVREVIPHSFKHDDQFNARINLTFRTCTNFSDEQEAQYQTAAYVARLRAAATAKAAVKAPLAS